jgi:hypothetical protein
VIRVFRNPEKAFPIALSNSISSAKAAVEGLNNVKAEVGAEHQAQIEAILIRLTDSNSSLMAEHHAAYIAFSGDPCFKPGYLHERFEALQQDRMALDTALLRARILEGMLKSGGSQEEISTAIKATLAALEPPMARQVAGEIRQAAEHVDRWANQ